jgi:hypothetical protein
MSRTGICSLHGRAAARQLYRGLAAAGAGACLLTSGAAAWMPGSAQHHRRQRDAARRPRVD